jgi:hypothetical protein
MTTTPDELLQAAIRRAKLAEKPVKEGAAMSDLTSVLNPPAGGRWSASLVDKAQDKAHHTSDQPTWRPHYPNQPSPWQNDPGLEPPLGYSIDDQIPVGNPREIEESVSRLQGSSSSPPEEGALHQELPTDVVAPPTKPLRRI